MKLIEYLNQLSLYATSDTVVGLGYSSLSKNYIRVLCVRHSDTGDFDAREVIILRCGEDD